jgi:hypothetical protein
MSSFLENLDRELAGQRPGGYALQGKGGERHGSWEWTYYKESGLHRFVIVAFTPMPGEVGVGQPPYYVEVFAGADDDSRFVRRLVRATRYLDAKTEDVTSFLKDWLTACLEDASNTATQLTSGDLVDAYPAFRRPARKSS